MSGYRWSRYICSAALLGVVMFAAPLAAEELAAPQMVIKTTSDKLKKLLSEEKEALKNDPDFVFRLANDLLLPHIDFDRVSALVLGKYWRRASPEQRVKFSSEFQRLLVRTYSTAVHEFDSWEIRYLPLRVTSDQNEVLVRTQVLRQGAPPVSVDYRMYLAENGHWKAYDVTIEGISLVTNYRSSFARMVRESGMKGLIEKMSALNNARAVGGEQSMAASEGGR